MPDQVPILCYASGDEAREGDRVDLDGWKAVVVHVLASEEQLKQWGLDQPGLMFNTERAGLVFQARESGDWDSIILLGRAT